jgi:hypothetical protein
MLDRPDAAALLEQARADYRTVILPRVPRECRYTALMILRAMEIAGRELETRDEVSRKALGQMQALFEGEGAECLAGPELDATLERLAARLVRGIRAGDFDGDARVPLVLRALTMDTLSLNNPKLLVEPSASPRE